MLDKRAVYKSRVSNADHKPLQTVNRLEKNHWSARPEEYLMLQDVSYQFKLLNLQTHMGMQDE